MSCYALPIVKTLEAMIKKDNVSIFVQPILYRYKEYIKINIYQKTQWQMLCRNIKQNIEKKSQEMTFNSLDKKGVSEVLTFGQDLNEVGITVCTEPQDTWGNVCLQSK